MIILIYSKKAFIYLETVHTILEGTLKSLELQNVYLFTLSL